MERGVFGGAVPNVSFQINGMSDWNAMEREF